MALVQYACQLSSGSRRTSRAMLQVPMAMSCFPRKWKILARRFRMGGLSLAISMAWVREEGKRKPFVRFGPELEPCLWVEPHHPAYPPTSKLNRTLGYSHWHSTPESLPHCHARCHVHRTCPVNPSRPQANPSSSDTLVCAPPRSQDRLGRGQNQPLPPPYSHSVSS